MIGRLGRKSIATLWRDAQEGTSPMPTIRELKDLLLYRRHHLNNLTFWWKMPKIDALSSVDFFDLIVVAKVEYYLANGLDEPWFCFEDHPLIQRQVNARLCREEGGPLDSEAGRGIERHAYEIATLLVRHAQHVEVMRRAA